MRELVKSLLVNGIVVVVEDEVADFRDASLG